MCQVNVTDFRKNLFHYLELCSSEDIRITNGGKVVAVLSNPDKEYYKTLADLCGCLKADFGDKTYDDIIGEEILKKCGF
ncbi:MAG: type II toxin-antitoxin system prevent-host-death family antitoxin [Bacilli bacterium]|nr:type II toxin-antitoxin system prevent-host-death family antitoxin [Bacilli bacterium]